MSSVSAFIIFLLTFTIFLLLLLLVLFGGFFLRRDRFVFFLIFAFDCGRRSRCLFFSLVLVLLGNFGPLLQHCLDFRFIELVQ